MLSSFTKDNTGSSLTAQQALEGLSRALGGSIHLTAELHEQYSQLHASSVKASHIQQLETLSSAHLQQLELAERIVQYSLSAPKAQLIPTQISAFMMELAALMPRQLASASPHSSGQQQRACVWLDATMLQPLLQNYIYETLSAEPTQILYDIAFKPNAPIDVLLYPAGLNQPSQLQWRIASALLPEQSAREGNQYDLCLSYGALIQQVHPVYFAEISAQLYALKISFNQLK